LPKYSKAKIRDQNGCNCAQSSLQITRKINTEHLISSYQFPGPGQRVTPTVSAMGMKELLRLLPKEKVVAFYKCCNLFETIHGMPEISDQLKGPSEIMDPEPILVPEADSCCKVARKPSPSTTSSIPSISFQNTIFLVIIYASRQIDCMHLPMI
jgi:hypothetical protein